MDSAKDLELMKMLAKTVAEETVREMLDKVRDEISAEIKGQFSVYFGDMTATEHAVSHNRLGHILTRMDKTADTVWSKVIDGAWKAAIAAIAAFAIFGSKLGWSH